MAEFHRDFARELIEAIAPHWSDTEKGAAMRTAVGMLRHKVAVMTHDIRDFHEKFGLEYEGGPRALPRELHSFRSAFMQEELDEYREAHEAGDLEKQFDALIDLIYVALGTSYMQGFPFADGWKRVQLANMAKVRALREGDSKRGSTYDVVKPPGWTAPVLTDLVQPKDGPKQHDLF